MNSKIPPYLYEKGNIVRLILFTALFALLFINIFQPFGSRGWYPEISDTKYFVFSSLIILTGMLVVVVSRMIMYYYALRLSISYVQFALWILCEILAMSLFFSLFTKFIPSQGAEREFTEIFRSCTINTGLILLLPYSISWLYLSWKEKNRMIEKLKVEESAAEVHSRPMVAFTDEKGELKFSLMVENLLYIDSANNYATIHYLNKSKLSHYLLRNTLKWVDENLTKDTPLVRCHRSYVVNLDKVKVLRKTKTGIYIELDAENTPDIPVSKTYYERFMKKFSPYSV